MKFKKWVVINAQVIKTINLEVDFFKYIFFVWSRMSDENEWRKNSSAGQGTVH